MAENKESICFILPTLNSGGMEHYLLRFLQWAKLGSRACVVVKSCRDAELHSEYTATGARVDYRATSYLNPRRWAQFYRFLRQNKFRAICDFTGDFAGITLLFARIAGVPKRIAFYRRSSHAFRLTFARLLYAGLINRLVYSHSTRILSNSQYALDVFFGARMKCNGKFRVIYNGCNKNRFNGSITKEEARRLVGLPSGAFIIGHVGRYDQAKNHKFIFSVAKLLRNRIDKCYFVFCGRGTDRSEFKDAMTPYGIDDIVISLGSRNDVEIVLSALDVFFFPSVTEGQPNALIEAMLSGVPVVASNIEPIKEIIPQQYWDKTLINPHDIDAAQKLLLANKAGSSGQRELREHAISTFDMASNFKRFLEEL